MESSQIFGEEECHSSESGWTMYLGSPINDDGTGTGEDDDGDSADEDGDDHNKRYNDDSGDSMASDASSGPSHQGIAHLKLQKEDKHAGKYYHQMQMKSNKQKKAEKGRKEDKEGMSSLAKGANFASTQSGSKARMQYELKIEMVDPSVRRIYISALLLMIMYVIYSFNFNLLM